MSDNEDKLASALSELSAAVKILHDKVDARSTSSPTTWTQAITTRVFDALDKHGVAVVLVFVLLGLLSFAGWKLYEGILKPQSDSAIQAMDRVAKATEMHAAAMANIDKRQDVISADVESIRQELGRHTTTLNASNEMLKKIHDSQRH